jgi:hypothetical protein
MVKYNRVSTRNDSDNLDRTSSSGVDPSVDHNHHHSHYLDFLDHDENDRGMASASSASVPLEVPLDAMNLGVGPLRPNLTKRSSNLSYTSSGSYHSIINDGDNHEIMDPDDDDVEDHDNSIDEEDDGEAPHESVLRSPLRRSFNQGKPDQLIGGGGDALSYSDEQQPVHRIRSTNGLSNATEPTNQTQVISPPPQQQAPVYPLYSDGSFDMEVDEDDEDELDLKRYHLDFASTSSSSNNIYNQHHQQRGGNSLTNSLPGGNSNSSNGNNSSLFGANYGGRFSLGRYLWHSFQTARQKARQRRAQMLLQQTERNWVQSTWICIKTTCCDATDRGIVLVVGLLMAWIIALIFTSEQDTRRRLLLAGIILFSIRLGLRPLCECYWRQRQKQRQSDLEQIRYSPAGGVITRQIEAPQYLDRRMSSSNNSTSTCSNHNSSISQHGSLELHEIGYENNGSRPQNRGSGLNAAPDFPPRIQTAHSNGSDPMVAAI